MEEVIPQGEVPAAASAENTNAPVEPKADELDYKVEYERAKEQLAKAEYTLYKQKKQERVKKEAEEQVQQDLGYIDQDKVRDLIDQEVKLTLESIRERESDDLIEELVNQESANPDEKSLIRLHYDNSIVKTGFSRQAIVADLRKAKLLANAPRYIKERAEVAEAAKSRNAIPNTSVGTNLDRPEPSDDLSKSFNSYDWNWMQKRHWSPEQIKKAADLKKEQSATPY